MPTLFNAKVFENKAFFCYTQCVNTGRIVMATLQNFKRNVRSYAAYGLASGLTTIFGLGLGSCGKGEEPSPVKPVDPVTQYKVDSVDVKMNIIANIGMSTFTDNGFLNEDKTISYGLGSRVYSAGNDKVSTGASGYDNIKFKVSYNKDNITSGTNSVKGGEYYVAAKRPKDPILTYTSAVAGGILKTDVVTDEVNKRKIVNRIKAINIFVQEASGIRIQGSKFADNDAYLKYIENCASAKSTEVYSRSNVMDLDPKSKTYEVIQPGSN